MPSRADILPVALTAFVTFAELTRADRGIQSNHNLRFGMLD